MKDKVYPFSYRHRFRQNQACSTQSEVYEPAPDFSRAERDLSEKLRRAAGERPKMASTGVIHC